jgi:broad specificity phosphatase PhoE
VIYSLAQFVRSELLERIANTDLYLVRHGQTGWALAGKHTGRTDIPLTEEGRRQADVLREPLSKIDFDAVFTSPLLRARDTASLAGFPNAVALDDLAELDYGQYEGKTISEIRQVAPGWTVWTGPCPGGELLQDAAERAQRVIERACQYQGKVLLVSHGHFLRILTAVWLQIDPSKGGQFMLDTATLSILSHEHSAPAVKRWNAPL